MGWTADKGNVINGMIIIHCLKREKHFTQPDWLCCLYSTGSTKNGSLYYFVNFYLLVTIWTILNDILLFVFIVSLNTTFRTPCSQLSSTTWPIHVVDDSRIYGVLKVVFSLTINTDWQTQRDNNTKIWHNVFHMWMFFTHFCIIMFNEMFSTAGKVSPEQPLSGRQPRQDVKVFWHFRDWLCSHLQSVNGGLVESTLMTRCLALCYVYLCSVGVWDGMWPF